MYLKILKKFIILLTIFLFLFNTNFIYADDINENDENNENINISSEVSSVAISEPTLNSKSCVVIDRLSKKVLYGKNENNKVKMASTTKIMTAIVIIETSQLDKTIEVSKKAANTGGSKLGLKTGDKISVLDLLYGLMLCSGNDAAVALAEGVSGSISNFSELMNKKAQSLNLTNTNFESPHGLDSDNHYTTAYELSILTDYALKNTTFRNIVSTKSYTININGYPKTLNNTNELLGNLNVVYGVKTGFTNGANRCLVTACKRGDLDIICVVLGADTKKFRTQDSIKLIEYVFKNFEYVDIEKIIDTNINNWKKENYDSFNITKGKSNNIDIYIEDLTCPIIPIKKEYINSINTYIVMDTTFEAPLEAKHIIGNITIKSKEEIIIEIAILCNNQIKKKNILDYFSFFITSYHKILEQNIYLEN